VVVKIALLATLVGLGAINRYRSIPAVGTSTHLLSRVGGVELVRYRRTGGCILRYRLGPGGDRASVYGRAGYATPAGTAEVLRALAAAGPRPAERDILYPHELGRCADLGLVLVADVPGRRPDPGDEADLGALVEGAALVAATLHTSGLRAGAPHTPEDELRRARSAVELVVGDAPALAAWLTRVLDGVGAAARRTAARPPVLAHGDLTPAQLLLGEAGIGILDFDGLCQAEPALDLGRFTAYLRLALAKSGSAAGDGPAARLLAAHAELGGPPVAGERARLHTVVSLAQTAAHSWRQLKASRLRLVCGVLEREAAALSEG